MRASSSVFALRPHHRTIPTPPHRRHFHLSRRRISLPSSCCFECHQRCVPLEFAAFFEDENMIRLEAWRSIQQSLERWCRRLLVCLLGVVLARQALFWDCKHPGLLSLSSGFWIAVQQQAQYWVILFILFASTVASKLSVRRRHVPLSLSPPSRNSSDRDRTQDARNNNEDSGNSSITRAKRKIQAMQERKDSDSLLLLLALPMEIWVKICGNFLHPRDVTTLACVNRATRQQFRGNSQEAHQIWKRLWYRDYGQVLLQWNVGRDVLNESLRIVAKRSRNNSKTNTDDLEDRLSRHLDQMPRQTNCAMSLPEFYFVFGEVYVDYLLARRNDSTNNNCYLGLHGHLLDFAPFAEYHPGLARDDVLVECGQDATDYFEQLPHSQGARAIARQLAVVIHKGCLTLEADDNRPSQLRQCGLGLCQVPENLPNLLRWSNSRPLGILDEESTLSNLDTKKLFPTRRRNPKRRPPTLLAIRCEWDRRLEREQAMLMEQQQQVTSGTFSLWGNSGLSSQCSWRVYFDPLRQEWVKWDARTTLR